MQARRLAVGRRGREPNQIESAVGCWACGYVGNALALSTYPQTPHAASAVAGRGLTRGAQWRGDDLPDWQARRRPKPPSLGFDAVPHTVPSTHAGAVFHPLRPRVQSRSAARAGADARAAVSVCRAAGLQVVICSCCDRGQIYCAGDCAQDARQPGAACRRPALPGEPPRAA